MSKLKPVCYMHYFIGGYPPDGYYEDFELIKPCDLEEFPAENNESEGVVPLYAIPDGYHIVAIDAEQEARDMLAEHNEKVRSKEPRKGTTIQAY